ncbi:MAG TPA: alpha/beta hydrolase [Acidimicrobiales bacterium]|jgi:acetyl esterase|nr:alpha/beta hydrolase [Acidimicrobiales bacterium]
MRTEIYETANGRPLAIELHGDDAARPARPAILFFHGGGWVGGSPEQFRPQCEHLASLGFLAATAAYRLVSGSTTIHDTLSDARSAIRWARRNARRLGADPARLAVGGGSAGAHLAACCALADDAAGDPTRTDRPDALVLFNPVLDVADLARRVARAPRGRHEALRAALHAAAACSSELSPIERVRPGAPPTLVLHGEADELVPVGLARRFCASMRRAGNDCQLVEYPNAPHGFFNGRGNPLLRDALNQVVAFLSERGFAPAGSRPG